MNTAELFCGTKSFSNVAKERGHNTFTMDYNGEFSPDLQKDILELSTFHLPLSLDVLWLSPPCTCFSVASIGTHWNRDRTPKSENAAEALKIIDRCYRIIDELPSECMWFMENPRGMMRKLPILEKFRRITVTYCQYGDTRMKPTDIFTNTDIELKPPCKNGAPCHEAAPRGSRTGTQGVKGAKNRSVIPALLCEDIIIYCENERSV